MLRSTSFSYPSGGKKIRGLEHDKCLQVLTGVFPLQCAGRGANDSDLFNYLVRLTSTQPEPRRVSDPL